MAIGIPESQLVETATMRDFIRFVAKRNLEAKRQQQKQDISHMKKLAHGKSSTS